jgi:uncharacterized Tic20 family protein
MTDLTSTPPPAAAASSVQERQWGMAAHLSAFAGFLIPFGSILGPLVVWLVKREEMPFVNDQGKEALNFNILAGIIAVALLILTVGTFGLGALLTVPIGIALGIVWIIFTIMAAIKANEGVSYRYPVNLRLVK